MIVGWLTTSSARRMQIDPRWGHISPFLVITLVMLVWGVASQALRDIITRFLNEVRFD
jgi:hypothetical protein